MEASFTPINDVGEFGLIDRIDAVLGPSEDEDVLAGIADDAAVYRIAEGRVHVVTTDALIEGVHFDRLFMPMEYLGFKSISVNVSDVAAMNASPRFATIALGVPSNVSVEMVEAFYRGVGRACEAYGMSVVGGDTTAARFFTIAITVIGDAREADVIYRRGAMPGDLLCVTGDLGAAYAGLKVLLSQREEMREAAGDFEPDLERYQYVIQRQLVPRAQVATVIDWAARGIRPHALIDISDGLASEVNHICRQSGCGVLVYGAAVPVAVETRAVADEFGDDVDTYALYGGEDYQLLFAIDEDDVDRLERSSFNIVGQFTEADAGILLRTPEGETVPLEAQGFAHF